ncbi:MAG: LytR C-terminal domain-containing protein [Candidatus Levybacteria bacterium]|nr:LytR C-terminal domain-containing protein [Candidatus Levybacteria bacterium]
MCYSLRQFSAPRSFMEEQPNFSNIGSTFTKTSRRPRMIVFVLLFLAILGVSIYFGSSFLGSNEQKDDISPTPMPTSTPMPTDTPTPSVSPTGEDEKETPTPTKRPTKPTSASDLDRSSLSISVQNGSGTKGVAAEMATFLKDLGYSIAATGNADNFDYQNVTIKLKSAQAKYLSQLKKDLAGSYAVGSATSDLSASESADAVVIIGK